jgi:hypothetical protein
VLLFKLEIRKYVVPELNCPINIAVGSTKDSKIEMRGKSRVNKIDRFHVGARLAQLSVFESHI